MTDVYRQFPASIYHRFNKVLTLYVKSDAEEDLKFLLLLDSNYLLKQYNTKTWIHDFNKDRGDSEFVKTNWPMINYPDIEYHMMRTEMFDYILELIKCDLVKHSNLRDCISPEEKLTITLRLSLTYILNH